MPDVFFQIFFYLEAIRRVRILTNSFNKAAVSSFLPTQSSHSFFSAEDDEEQGEGGETVTLNCVDVIDLSLERKRSDTSCNCNLSVKVGQVNFQNANIDLHIVIYEVFICSQFKF